ncbi:MAG TPA: hypothetical protein VM639_03715 [Dongiaceae bacterium]|nr:hypothetical protein [Dongiaceae bacterium]
MAAGHAGWTGRGSRRSLNIEVGIGLCDNGRDIDDVAAGIMKRHAGLLVGLGIPDQNHRLVAHLDGEISLLADARSQVAVEGQIDGFPGRHLDPHNRLAGGHINMHFPIGNGRDNRGLVAGRIYAALIGRPLTGRIIGLIIGLCDLYGVIIPIICKGIINHIFRCHPIVLACHPRAPERVC